MNKSVTVDWEDEDNVRSYAAVAKSYGLKVINAKEADVYKTEVTFYGPAEKIEAFIEDYEEDSIEPLESLSLANEYDEDYEAALSAAIADADADAAL